MTWPHGGRDPRGPGQVSLGGRGRRAPADLLCLSLETPESTSSLHLTAATQAQSEGSWSQSIAHQAPVPGLQCSGSEESGPWGHQGISSARTFNHRQLWAGGHRVPSRGQV